MKRSLILLLLVGTAISTTFVYRDDILSKIGINTLADSQEQAKALVNPPAATPKLDTPPREPSTATTSNVDESALRYFAAKGDKERVQREINRLKALYPQWTPPADPLAPVQLRDEDLDHLWELFAEGKYAEVRTEIEKIKNRKPEWKAPDDLLNKLAAAETRLRLVNASDAKQYDMVISLASQNSALLTCDEVDVMWRLADAFAKTEKPDRARDSYAYVLQNCTKPEERLVTIQKALEVLPYKQIQSVLTEFKPSFDGHPEFAALEDDIARRFVAAVAEKPDESIDKSYVTRLEQIAQKGEKATDAEMLGWYFLHRKDPQIAQQWFERAGKRENSVTIAQGLALVDLELRQNREAENAMYEWRDTNPEATAVYFATTARLLGTDEFGRPLEIVPQEILERVAKAVVKHKEVETTQQLGWYARSLNQHETAIQWFDTVLGIDPENEPSAYGLAVSFYTLGDKASLKLIKEIWARHSQRIADVGTIRDPKHPTHIRSPYNHAIQVPTNYLAQYANGYVAPPTQAVMPTQQQIHSLRQVGIATPYASQAPIDRTYVHSTSNKAAPRKSKAKTNVQGCRSSNHSSNLVGQSALNQGWCLMRLNRPLEAVKYFESALQTGNNKVRSDAAYGQSLAYLRVGLVAKASVAATSVRMTPTQQREIRVAVLADQAVAAYKSGQYRQAILLVMQRDQIAQPRKDLMALQAASYLKLNRWDDANQIYSALAATGDKEGRRGLAAVRDLKRE